MNKLPAETIPIRNEPPQGKVKIFYSLVYLRKRNNVTQTQLAKDLDIHRSHLSLVESGKRSANSELLHKIADYFKVDIETLEIEPWTVEMAKQMIAEDVASLYHGSDELCMSRDDRQFLLQVVRTLTPQILVEEKVTTTNEDGNRIREKVERKLAQHGIELKGRG